MKIESVSDKHIRISHSSMGQLASCARKFELRKLYKQPPKVVTWDDSAAQVGVALHTAYQDWLINGDADRALWVLGLHYPHSLIPDSSHDRSWEAAMSTLEAMIESVPMKEFELAMIKNHRGEIVPAVEVPFAFEFTGFTLPGDRKLFYVGYIDAIMIHKMTGMYRTMDIKTHRRRVSNPDAKFKFDGQQIPYGIALEHVQGLEIIEFEIFYLECFVDVLEPEISTHRYRKNQTHIQEWLANKVIQIRTLYNFLEMDLFPRTEHGCLAFNKPCAYIDICESRDKEVVQKWLLGGNKPEEEKPFEPWISGVIPLPEGLIA